MAHPNQEHNLLVLKSQSLDESAFLLVAANLLEKKLGSKHGFIDFLAKLKTQYFHQDYQGALESLRQYAKKHEDVLGAVFVQALVDKSMQLTSNPNENTTRRFFETIYAQNLDKQAQEISDFSVFHDLNGVYNRVKPEFVEDVQTKIENYEQARKLMLAFEIMNDSIELGLKDQSSLYKKKDRNRAELGDVLISSPGIMRSTAPNYADKLVEAHKMPKIEMDPNKKTGYSHSNPQTPFVASVSGTTFTLMVVLTEYVKEHKDDTNLQANINQIINFWNATYIKEGYHSIRELVDVFNEPHIKKVFTDANVTLDFCQRDAFDAAFAEAQSYAVQLANRSVMHEELIGTVQRRQEIAQRKANIVKNMDLIMDRITQGVENPGPHQATFAELKQTIQSWAEGKKDNTTFKNEAHQIFEGLRSVDALNNTSANAFKQWVNELIAYVTFDIIKTVFTVPLPAMPKVATIESDIVQIPDSIKAPQKAMAQGLKDIKGEQDEPKKDEYIPPLLK